MTHLIEHNLNELSITNYESHQPQADCNPKSEITSLSLRYQYYDITHASMQLCSGVKRDVLIGRLYVQAPNQKQAIILAAVFN